VSRKPWSDRLTVEECRSLNIARLVRSGLFGNAPNFRFVDSRGLQIAVTSAGPTRAVPEWTWNGMIHEKAPAPVNQLKLSYTLGPTQGAEAIRRSEDERVGGAILEHGARTIEQDVEILSIPSPLGRGRRYYFKCPWCDRRVGKLYMPSGGTQFACRICYDLTYRSSREHNKRLDVFLRHPPEELVRLLESPDWNTRWLAVQAARRIFKRARHD